MEKIFTFFILFVSLNINAQICFDPYTNFAVGLEPKSIISADFNGDAISDLAIANYDSHNISVLLGMGSGSFNVAANFPVGSLPHSIISGDFNGDGKVDLAVANSGSDNVSVLIGTGTGSFSTAVNFIVDNRPMSITSADFNGDGNADLATSNIFADNVTILLGTGTGSFSTTTVYASFNTPLSIISADFNGDSIPDLAIVNYNGDDATILLGTGTGSFTPGINYAVGNSPYNITSADFNGDTMPDLAFGDYSGYCKVLLNLGSGSFGAPTNHCVPGPVFSADFNNDGKADLAIGGTDDVEVALGTGAGSFMATTIFPSGDNYSLTIGDFNGDNIPDIATANNISNDASVLLSCMPVGINVAEQQTISVYPNPSEGNFTVNLKNVNESTICIYDVLGNCILNKRSMNDANPQFDLSHQSKGIYFMEIVSDGERVVKKIVLQ